MCIRDRAQVDGINLVLGGHHLEGRQHLRCVAEDRVGEQAGHRRHAGHLHLDPGKYLVLAPAAGDRTGDMRAVGADVQAGVQLVDVGRRQGVGEDAEAQHLVVDQMGLGHETGDGAVAQVVLGDGIALSLIHI